MGKKGLHYSLFFSVSILLILFVGILGVLSIISIPTVSAAIGCLDTGTGVCIPDRVNDACPSGPSIQTVDSSACGIAGCCCYAASGASGNSSVGLVSQSYCTAPTYPNSFWRSMPASGSCSDACAQINTGSGTGVSNTTSGGTNGTTNVGTGGSNTGSQTTGGAGSTCTGTISGVINPANSIPGSGILVYAAVSPAQSSYGAVATDGSFRITAVCAGDNTVDIIDGSGSFYVNSPPVVTLTDGQSVSNVVLNILPKNLGTIKGKVVQLVNGGQNGQTTQAVATALVHIQGTPYSAYSSSTGDFSIAIPNVPSSGTAYTLLTTAQGFIPDQTPVFVGPNSNPAMTGTVQINLTTESCLSSQGTTANTPSGLIISHTQGQPQLTLQWTMQSCGNVVQQYTVQRCVGSQVAMTGSAAVCGADGNFLDVATLSPTSALTYTDSNVDWGQNYTYRVVAIFSSAISRSSPAVTEDSGDAPCATITSSTPFCGTTSGLVNNKPTQIAAAQYCDDKNKLHTTACTGSTSLCAQRASGYGFTAQCVAPQACTVSSNPNPYGPFGLYYNQQSCIAQAGPGVCYFDKNQSNVNACLQCKPTMTCADYHTQSACGAAASTCGTNYCQWVVTDAALGTGVCSNTKTAACGSCSDPSATAFGVCDPETCKALSTGQDACFYYPANAAAQAPASCKQCSATQCGDYLSQASCEGWGPAAFDVQTNAFLGKQTTDSCGINVCRWESTINKCVKDANAGLYTPRNDDDCVNSFDATKCNLDRTPPTTFIVVPNVSNPFKSNVIIKFIAQDAGASGANQVLHTRFCVSRLEDSNSSCVDASKFSLVPTGQRLNITTGNLYVPAVSTGLFTAPQFGPFLFSDGTYVIRYYSVDNALNLETVKSMQFSINTTGPSIAITADVFSNTTSRRSDVVATVSSTIPTKCNVALLAIGDVTSIPDTITSTIFTTVHQQVFKSNVDGVYGIKATCADAMGNVVVSNYTVTLASDSRIMNLQPNGRVGNNTPLISFQTNDPVQCRMTTDSSKLTSFSSMEYSFGSYQDPITKLYNQTLQMPALPDGNFTAWISCNFNPASFSQVSLLIDTQLPSISFQDVTGTAFNFSRWNAGSPQLYAACVKPGVSNAVCDGYEYCIVPAVFAAGFSSAGSAGPGCVPNIRMPASSLIGGRALIPFGTDDYSSTVCVHGLDSVGGSVRVGPTVCGAALIDWVNPSATFSSIPSVVNKNTLPIAGQVSDPTATFASVPLTYNPGAQPAGSYATLNRGKLNATNVFVNGSLLFRFDATKPSYLDINVRGNSSSVATVRIDALNPQAPALEIIVGGVTLNSTPLSLAGTGQVVRWSVQVSGSVLTAAVVRSDGVTATTSASVATAGNLPGTVNFIAVNTGTGNNRVPDVTLTNVQYYDLDLAANNPVQLYLIVNDPSDPRSSVSSLPSVGSFNTTVTLDTPADLVEGRSYGFTIYTQDPAGRTSTPITKYVQFSLLGPDITGINFVPTNLSQADKSYIEFRQSATATVMAKAQYGLGSANISVLGNIQNISTIITGGIQGLYDTSTLPVGLLDVSVAATDAAGTATTAQFPRALWIRNLLDPYHNISINDIILTNNTLPTITAGVYDASITCKVTYTTASGTVVTENMATAPTGNGLVRTLTLSNPLPSIDGGIVDNSIIITCSNPTNPSDTWSHLVHIIVDRRPPVIGVSVSANSASGMVLTGFTRTVKNYVSFVPGVKTLSIISDKPVICRAANVSGSAVGMQAADRSAFYASLGADISANNSGNYSNSLQTLITTVDSSTQSFAVSCMDQAGNIANFTRYVTISTDSNGAPYIAAVSPTVATDNTQTVVSATVISSAATACLATQTATNNVAIPVSSRVSYPLTASNTYYGLYPASLYQTSIPLADNTSYAFNITCTANGKTSAATATFFVDTSYPVINFLGTDASGSVSAAGAPAWSSFPPAIIKTQSAIANLTLNTSKQLVVFVSSGSHVLAVQNVPAGISTLAIPAQIGVATVSIETYDNDLHTTIYYSQIRRAAQGFSSQFSDALADSVGAARTTSSAQLTSLTSQVPDSGATVSASLVNVPIPDAAGQQIAPAVIGTWSSQPVTAAISDTSNATGQSAGKITFTLPTLADGWYALSYRVKDAAGSPIAADTAFFYAGALDENAVLVLPVNQTQRRGLGYQIVNISVPYLNVLTSELSQWGLAQFGLAGATNSSSTIYAIVNRSYERASAKLPIAEGNYLFSYALVNELGLPSMLSIPVSFDVTPPVMQTNLQTISAAGTTPTVSTSPVPRFLVTSSGQYAYLISASIKGIDGIVHPVSAIDVDPNQFSSSFTLRSTDSLSNGGYTLQATFSDAAGNKVSLVKQFSVQNSGLQVSLLSPRFGLTSADTMPVTIGTDRPASCRIALAGSALTYDAMTQLTSDDGFSHTTVLSFANAPNGQRVNYLVSCIEDGTTAPIVNQTFALGKSITAPQITGLTVLNAINGVVADPLGRATISVDTSIPAICRYSDQQSLPYELMTPFDSTANAFGYNALGTNNKQLITGLSDGGHYTYYVMCDNGAGVTSTASSVSFSMDSTQNGLINIVSPASGHAYTTQNLPLTITLVRPAAQGCTWGRNSSSVTTPLTPTSADKLTYNLSTTFAYGANDVLVQCIFEGKDNTFDTQSATSHFVIDNTPPTGYVVLPVNTSVDSGLNVDFEFTDNESGISLYEYVIGTAPYSQTGWNDTRNITATTSSYFTDRSASLIIGKTYYVTVRATNGAGTKSTWVSSNGTLAVAGKGVNCITVGTKTKCGNFNANTTNSSATTTIDLPIGTIITFLNGSRIVVNSSTKLTIPSQYASLIKPGLPLVLPFGSTLTINGVPVDATGATVMEPAIQTSTTVPVNTTATSGSTSGSKSNNSGSKPVTKPDQTQKPPVGGAALLSSGLLIFCLALLLVGGGAGFLVYNNRKEKARRAAAVARSSSIDDEVVSPSRPLTVQDKLKVALQSHIRKQHSGEVSSKASHLFSAFDKDGEAKSERSDASKSGKSDEHELHESQQHSEHGQYQPRIGVTKIDRSNIPATASDASPASKSPIERSQAAAERLRTIANRQRSALDQLRHSKIKPGSGLSSKDALDRLKSMKRK